MVAEKQKVQETSGNDAVQQALQKRDACRAQFLSLHQLALSFSAIAVSRLAAIEFSRLKKNWLRDPAHFHGNFAANHLGVAYMAERWSLLVSLLEGNNRMPSLDLILDCIRSIGSSVNIQNLNDDGWFILSRFLYMHEIPESAITAILKISKCVDQAGYRESLNALFDSSYDEQVCRLELLHLARKQAAELQKSARLAKARFEEYAETLKKSPVPACQVDRALGAALRDAHANFNCAEREYKAILSENKKRESLKHETPAPTAAVMAPTPVKETEPTPQQSVTTVSQDPVQSVQATVQQHEEPQKSDLPDRVTEYLKTARNREASRLKKKQRAESRRNRKRNKLSRGS